MRKLSSLFILFIFLFQHSGAQIPQAAGIDLTRDYSKLMEIPGIITIAGTTTHLYVLSETDGLIVFRAHADSLQWLYSSEGMQRRGRKLQADIRFAYLTGTDNRLTVVEPTSVLGVYSSTTLPARPGRMARIGNHLFFGMDRNGLYRLSLESPESVDTMPEQIREDIIGPATVTDIAATGRQLLVLTSDEKLHQFTVTGGNAEHQRTFTLDHVPDRLFVIDNTVYVTDASGTVFELSGTGALTRIIETGSRIETLFRWSDVFVVRSVNGEIIAGSRTVPVRTLRSDHRAGNLIALTKRTLWMSEYNQISPVIRSTARPAPTVDAGTTTTGTTGTLRMKPVGNHILPFPRALLFPIELEGNFPATNVHFQVRGSSPTATIRDQGFYWQPGSREVGLNRFTIIASSTDGQVDSTSFSVEIRAFNAPPRFNPVRQLSIPVGEQFELPIRATDPDGSNPDLIRYLGVNLPDGATINERTGMFTWTPTRRQTGTHEFQVIATDQFGSAASLTVSINVLELGRRD